MVYLAVIEITNACNLKCKHCYGTFDKGKKMLLSDFSFLCDELRQNGCRTVRLSGGEPLCLGENLEAYILSALENKLKVEITTNGTMKFLISKETLKKVSAIQVSIDGIEKIHDSIRGEGNYKKAWKTIDFLKEEGINVNIMMTVGTHNICCVENVFEEAQMHEIPMFLERITYSGRAEESMVLSPSQLKQLFKICYEKGIQTSDPLFRVMDRNWSKVAKRKHIICGCSAGICAICVDADMNVLPCPRLRVSCGNILNLSLAEILKNDSFRELQDRSRLEGKCGKCIDKWICGGCRADSYAYAQLLNQEDGGCFL